MDFPVKSIRWSLYEQTTPILLQVSNGSCPLIALVNTLLLQEDVSQRSETPRQDLGGLRRLLQSHVGGSVPSTDVTAALGDILLAMSDLDPSVLDKLLNSLPLLQTGLEVNPNLTTGSFPETDLAAQIFTAFGLRFVHGWVSHPSAEIASVFSKHQDYDAIQDYILRHEGSDVSFQIQSWLNENSTQLTDHGLQLMHQEVAPETVLIFFRNNHFSTLYKAEDTFHVLVTDGSFGRSAEYVWQSLSSVSGGSDVFYSGDFQPISGSTDAPAERYEPGAENMLLLSQMQMEEDENYAALLQERYNRRKSAKSPETKAKKMQRTPKRATSMKVTGEKPQKSKSGCIIS